MSLVAYLLIAYLLGAFPTSVVAGRILRGIDVRQYGSGNAGATNTWRVLGWRAGLIVLALDMAKGAGAAALVPRIPLGGTPLDGGDVAVLCGLAAVLGHVFPIYIGFHGGKGVATAAGMLLATAPVPMGIGVAVFGLVALLSGRISLGSILLTWTVPIAALLLNRAPSFSHPPLLIGVMFGLAAFILFTHRANLRRLVRGEERSFSQLQVWRRLFRR